MDRIRTGSLRAQYRENTERSSKKNNIRSRYGKIEVGKIHGFSQPVLGSRTSPYLQEKLVLLGCQNVFNSVPKVVESILGIPVNESQVYRICQAVSNQIDDEELDSPSEGLEAIENEREECVYGMVDGSMLPTDEGWQECKVGRVFKAEMIENSEPYKWEMGQSDYVRLCGMSRSL